MRKMLAKVAVVCLMAVILAGCSTAKLAADPAPEIPATPAAPVVAKAWTEVATWRGSGTKNTETFNVKSSEWLVRWSTKTQAASVGFSMLSICVYDEKGELVALVANTMAEGDDHSFVRSKPGNYYLEIMSLNCDWGIRVEDIR